MTVGFVYYIGSRSIHRPLVKIGFTRWDPAKRLRALQTGNGDQLFLLGYEIGTPQDERSLHRRFKQFRTFGEWFLAEDELLRELEARSDFDPLDGVQAA